MQSGAKIGKANKVRIKQKFAEKEQAVFSSTPGMHVPLIGNKKFSPKAYP